MLYDDEFEKSIERKRAIKRMRKMRKLGISTNHIARYTSIGQEEQYELDVLLEILTSLKRIEKAICEKD